MNPHFIFNSLNSINNFILQNNPDQASEYLTKFSKLMRQIAANTKTEWILLKDELQSLRIYLELEKLRSDNKFEVHFCIDEDLNTETIFVPPLLLQPYIENALWHGLSHKKENKNLELTVNQKANALVFRIQDNGVGRKKSMELKSLYRKEHKSKGMELLSKRFSLLSKEYGAEIKITVTDLMNSGEAMGTLVEITLPVSLNKKSIQKIA